MDSKPNNDPADTYIFDDDVMDEMENPEATVVFDEIPDTDDDKLQDDKSQK